MQTDHVTISDLESSVIAVPPLARDEDGKFCPQENRKIIEHIEKGNVTTLLYGGNANFYHVAPSEYREILEGLVDAAADNTLIIPAAGPSYGQMMDQAEVLREMNFPTAMILPQQGIVTERGAEEGIRRFAMKLRKPVVLYIKHEGFIDVQGAKRLVDEGLVSWIKYAIVREDTSDDPFLSELVSEVNPEMIVSGMGEQPVIEHMRDFGLVGFTSGCVCVRPALSDEMLAACRGEQWDIAEDVKKLFFPLEDLRNQINPIRVLHEALMLCGIADTGDHLPLLSPLSESERSLVRDAAIELLNP